MFRGRHVVAYTQRCPTPEQVHRLRARIHVLHHRDGLPLAPVCTLPSVSSSPAPGLSPLGTADTTGSGLTSGLNGSETLGKEDAASKITWLPTRAQGHNTPRPLLLAAVPVFMTLPGVPQKLMGVVATELSVESVIDSLRDAYNALAVHGSDAFILYHRGTAGELLAHNNGHACVLLLLLAVI